MQLTPTATRLSWSRACLDRLTLVMPVPATPSRFQRYVAVLSRWLFVFGMVFVLAKLAGDYVTTHWLPQYYRAKVEIKLLPRGIMQSSVMSPEAEYAAQVQEEFGYARSSINSSDALLPVIHNLRLNEAWAKRVFRKEESLSDQEALAYMKNSLKLELVDGTTIVKITVTDDDAKEAADIANAIADQYKKMRDDEDAFRNKRGLDALKEQIAQQQRVVDEKRAALEKIRNSLGSNDVDLGPTPLSAQQEQQEEQIEKALDNAKADLLAAEEDYDARKVLTEEVINLPDDQFISILKGIGRDPKITFDPTNPSQNRDQVAALRRAMQVDVATAKSRADLLQKNVNNLTQQVRESISNASKPFIDALRNFHQEESLLKALNMRVQQDKTDISLMQSPVRIISRAEVPNKPDHRMAPMLTLIGSGVLALMAASFVEMILLFQRAGERHGNG